MQGLGRLITQRQRISWGGFARCPLADGRRCGFYGKYFIQNYEPISHMYLVSLERINDWYEGAVQATSASRFRPYPSPPATQRRPRTARSSKNKTKHSAPATLQPIKPECPGSSLLKRGTLDTVDFRDFFTFIRFPFQALSSAQIRRRAGSRRHGRRCVSIPYPLES